MRRDIVVVGASAGGVQALERLVAGLREPLDASIFVVLHVSSNGVSVLPKILNRAGPVPAEHAIDGEAIEPGRIYVAPPNAHLLLDLGRVRLGSGPAENGHRPAVDALFRSAVYVYRSRVMGVVLSGTLDDGTAGLWAVKRRGGLAVVQDPAEAAHTGMPSSALQNVTIDHVLGVDAIGPLIVRASRERQSEAPPMAENDTRLGREVSLAADPTFSNPLEQPYGADATPAALSCPSCHGTLWEIQEDSVTRYRCQVGHAYSSATLLGAQNHDLEDALWAACRTLEENATLSLRLAARAGEANQHLARSHYEAKAKSAHERAALIRRALVLTGAAREAGYGGEAEADGFGEDGAGGSGAAIQAEGAPGGGALSAPAGFRTMLGKGAGPSPAADGPSGGDPAAGRSNSRGDAE